MSRNLQPAEIETFKRIYAVDGNCPACKSPDLTIRIYEGYGSPAKNEGGDLGPGNLIAAVVICNACGQGTTLDRKRLSSQSASAA